MTRLTKFSVATLLGVILLAGGIQATTETTFFTSYLPRLLFNDNFAPVVEGKFYRSAEMNRQDLSAALSKNSIRTVIDLRAGLDDPDSDGFTEEKTATSLGVDYVHIPMFASRYPSRETMLKLLETFQQAKQPLLVHCSSGTHRSGVVSAIWLLEVGGGTAEQARQQLSAYFGFFPLERRFKSWMQGHPTLDDMLFRYLDATKRESISFRDWVMRELPSENAPAT